MKRETKGVIRIDIKVFCSFLASYNLCALYSICIWKALCAFRRWDAKICWRFVTSERRLVSIGMFLEVLLSEPFHRHHHSGSQLYDYVTLAIPYHYVYEIYSENPHPSIYRQTQWKVRVFHHSLQDRREFERDVASQQRHGRILIAQPLHLFVCRRSISKDESILIHNRRRQSSISRPRMWPPKPASQECSSWAHRSPPAHRPRP
jgi:hypothetical protein